MRYSLPALIHNNEREDPLKSGAKTFWVYDLKGKKRLAKVHAKDMSSAAEKVYKLWPCMLKASHLSYPFVIIDQNGTLDLTK